MTGLRPQYLVAAELTLALIRDLEWVKVADPAAGAADDFQLATRSGQLHALQVKWSAYAGAFTFRELVGGSSPLLGSLADGWQRLSATSGARALRIHLVTNDYPSKNDEVRPAVAGSPDHFAAFIARSFRPVQDRLRREPFPASLSSCPEVTDWRAAWDELRRASGLGEDQFWAFIAGLDLNLGVSDDAFPELGRILQASRRDRDDLAGFFFDTVADPAHIVAITVGELLERLGWAGRLAFRNQHAFPVPTTYEPNDTAVRTLISAVEHFGGGYLALVAPAGAGKSSLLAATCLPADRIVRYYAYTPSAPDPSTGRGEAENFFYDVVTALDNTGLHTPGIVDPRDRLGNKDRLLRQLDAGHREWERGRRRTLIVVDGLDHIPREQRPARSLIDDLPSPSQVPSGVFIILGSQLTDILPVAVQASLAEPGRTVEVPPLPAAAVLAVAGKAGPGRWLLPAQRQRLISASEGHPLSLRYLLEELSGLISDPAHVTPEAIERADAVLADAATYGARIQERYLGYWQCASVERDLHRLLGITARLRSPIDLEWLRTWNQPELVARFAETFAPFFVKDGRSWTFIHNSFRIFLIDRTAAVAGRYDPDQNRRLHEETAQVCASSVGQWDIYRDEEISHRAAAEQHREVLALAASPTLRSRLAQLTPSAAIGQDVNLALRSAGVLGEPIALLQLALMKFELQLRNQVLDPDELALALISVGDYATGLRHILLGRDLRVEAQTALDAARRLLDAERAAEARAVMDAVGSLQVLLETAGHDRGPARDTYSLIQRWVSVHARVRPALEILSEIDAALPRAPAESPSSDHRAAALAAVAAGVPDSGEQREILAALDEIAPHAAAAMELRLPTDRSHAEVLARIDAAFAHLSIIPVPGLDTRWTAQLVDQVPASLRITAAEMLAEVSGSTPQARVLVSGCQIPQRSFPSTDDEHSLWQAYRLYRLRYLLKPRGGDGAFAQAESQPGDGMAIFHAALAELAELDASVWRSRLDPACGPGPAMTVARQLHRLYEVPRRQRQSRTSWYVAVGAAEAFFRKLICVVTSADPGAVAPLWELFSTAWEIPDRAEHWPYHLRIAILEALARAGANRDEIIRDLLAIRTALAAADGLAVHDRVEDLLKLATALRSFEATAEAAETLRIAVRESLSSGARDDDDQLSEWVKRFGELAKTTVVGTQSLREAATVLAVRLDHARAADASTADPARHLIEVTFGTDPGLAVNMAAWLAARGVLDSADGLAGLLAGAAASPTVPAELVADIMGSLYMPAAIHPLPEPTARLVDRGGDNVKQILAASIRRWVLPSMREKWGLSARADVAAPPPLYIGEPPQPTTDESTPIEPDQVSFSDGTRLSTDQAARLVTTPAELLALLRRMAPQDGYGRTSRLGQAVRKVTWQLHPDDAAALVPEFARVHADADSYAAVAARLIALGNFARAQDVVDEALRNTTMHGWISYWDGGTRRRFWTELTGADRTRFTPQAVDDLATALSVGAIQLEGLIHDLPEICNVLGVSPEHAWPVIDEFIGALCRPVGEETAWEPGERSESGAEAMLRHVAVLAGHPVRIIDWGARNVLRRALTDPRTAEVAAQVIADHLSGSSMAAEALLGAIAAAGHVPCSATGILREAVTVSASLKDQILRDTGQAAARALDIPCRAPSRRPLRLSYFLAAPPVPPHSLPVHDEDGVSILDPTNPRASLGTYDKLLEDRISHLSEIPGAMLIRQANRLGRELAERDLWTRGGVKAHAQRIKHSGWLHTYRPWPLMTGRRGAAAVLADLVDAGEVPDPAPSTVTERLELTDPTLDVAEPEALPRSIPRPARRSRFTGQSGTWTADTAEAARIYEQAKPNGEIVIGEWADWTELSWDRARERRVSLAHQPDLTAIGSLEIQSGSPPGALRWLEKQMNLGGFCSATAYKELASVRNQTTRSGRVPLIVGGQEWWAETGTDQWLALAPDLGAHLGWNLSAHGLFEWRDGGGERMAWSRWWIQCLDTHQPPHFDDDAGEGWQVLVTHAGWLQVSKVLGPLELSTVVARAGNRKADWEEEVLNTRRLVRQ